MRRRKAEDLLAAGAVATTTLTFGMLRAPDQPFWFDEAFTAGAAQQSFGDLGRFLWREAGMGPYYVVLWAWAHFGQSEWWLRSLSVLGGAATVATIYLFAATFINRSVAVLAVIGLCCNSFFLYNLTELRAYSWVMFAALATTWVFLRLRAHPSTSRSIAYGTAVGLSLGLLAFSAALVITHLLFTRQLWRSSGGRRALLIAGAIAATLFLPLAHALLTSDQIAWIPHTTASWADVQTAGAFGGTKWRLFYLGGCALLTVSLVRQRRRGAPHVALEVCALGAASTVITLFLISLAEPVFIARYMAGALPLLIVVGSSGYVFATRALIARAPRLAFAGWLVPMALATACVVGFRGSPLEDLTKPEDMRSTGQALRRGVAPDDVVVFGSDREKLAIGYYFDPPSGGTSVVGWGEVTDVDACTLWFVERGSIVELERRVRSLMPAADITATQYSGDAVVVAHRCT